MNQGGFRQGEAVRGSIPGACGLDPQERRPEQEDEKAFVTLRLSGQVIEAYKAKGPGWQSRIDADLRRLNKIK
jgi:uncharacterized protein (DUF4415 family)